MVVCRRCATCDRFFSDLLWHLGEYSFISIHYRSVARRSFSFLRDARANGLEPARVDEEPSLNSDQGCTIPPYLCCKCAQRLQRPAPKDLRRKVQRRKSNVQCPETGRKSKVESQRSKAGTQTLDTRLSTFDEFPDVGHWTLDIGHWTLDIGLRRIPARAVRNLRNGA
jgi:hypothetical protein